MDKCHTLTSGLRKIFLNSILIRRPERCLNNTVGRVPELRTGHPRNRESISGKGRRSSYFFPRRPDLLLGPLNITRVVFPEKNRPRRKAEHSPPYNAEVRNKWSFTSTPHMPTWHKQGIFYLCGTYTWSYQIISYLRISQLKL